MATSEQVYQKLAEFYTNPTLKLNEKMIEFSKNHVNLTGKNLDRQIINFISTQLRVTPPLSANYHTFKESIKWLMIARANLRSNYKPINSYEVPGFILKNIEEMSSNRGYIWKGQKFLGKKRPKLGPTVLFEPRRGRTLIHVYEKTVHKIFEKKKGSRYQALLKTISMEQDIDPDRNNKAKKEIKRKPKPNPRSRDNQVLGSFDILYDSDSG